MRLIWQFVATLLVVGFLLAYWWVIALLVLVVVVLKYGPPLYRQYQADVAADQAAEQKRLDGLRRRADQQHNWRMAGDPRGVFGQFPPAAC